MARTSKLTKDKPSATVNYPDDEKGPVTIKVTGGEEPFTKKVSFQGSGGGDGGSGDDGSGGGDDGGQQPTGDIDATVEQDQRNPRKVTVTVTKTPDSDSGSDSGSGSGSGEGSSSNGETGSEGGTQGSGSSTADQTSPRSRDSGSGTSQDSNGSSGSSSDSSGSGSSGGPLTIEWGGKTKGEAPTEITQDEPVTVEYDKTTEKATITIDDDDEKTEPFTKGLKFGAQPEPDGDIVVEAQQDESDPRTVTFTLTKAPEQTSGDSGSGSGSGDQGSSSGSDSSGSDSGSGSSGSRNSGGNQNSGSGGQRA